MKTKMKQARDSKGRFLGTAKPKKTGKGRVSGQSDQPIRCKTFGEFLATIEELKKKEK